VKNVGKGLLRGRLGVYLIIGIVVVLVLLGGTHGLNFDTVPSGWEIKAEVVGLGLSGLTQGSPPAPSVYVHLGDTNEWVKPFDRTARAQWDFDDPWYGYPDVAVETGNIREEISPSNYGNSPSEYNLDKFKYVIQYHEYLFDVIIKTVASVRQDPNEFGGYWDHETSMPYSWADTLARGGDKIGKEIFGNVYIRFANIPWDLNYTNAPSGYVAVSNGYWLGVMDATLENKEGGKVDNAYGLQENFAGAFEGSASGNSRFTMSADDGTFIKSYGNIAQGDQNKILSPDIKNTVIVQLPYGLLAGADDAYDWKAALTGQGGITSVVPINYFIKYTVRMECVVIKEYMQRDPALSPNQAPVQKPLDYVSGNVPSWWDQWGLWVIIGGIVVCALIAAGFFGIITISILFGR
jgi:hypothetical protein